MKCTCKTENVWGCSPLFADQQAQRTPLNNWDPQNSKILGLPLWECWASSSSHAVKAALERSWTTDTRAEKSPKYIPFWVGSTGSQGVQDGSDLGTEVLDYAKATKSVSNMWERISLFISISVCEQLRLFLIREGRELLYSHPPLPLHPQFPDQISFQTGIEPLFPLFKVLGHTQLLSKLTFRHML